MHCEQKRIRIVVESDLEEAVWIVQEACSISDAFIKKYVDHFELVSECIPRMNR